MKTSGILKWALLAFGVAGSVGLAVAWRSSASKPPDSQNTERRSATLPQLVPVKASSQVAAAPALERCSARRIDDFEHEFSGELPRCEGRVGSWYTFNDHAQGTKQIPAAGSPVHHVPSLSDGRGMVLRTHGYCQAGTPSGTLWGAGIGVDLNNPGRRTLEKGHYDAAQRGFRGLRFRARLGETAGATAEVALRVPDINSDPAGGRCAKCFDDYEVVLELKPTWNVYTIRWEQLQRAPGGDPQPFAADAIMGIQWRFKPGDMFDLYLDDIHFIR
jgi:hypothetical protein